MSLDPTTAAQLLDCARRDYDVAARLEREAKAACDAARDAWLACPGCPRFSVEYRDYNLAATAWQAAHEALCRVSGQVRECEVDLATAQRYSVKEGA